jgi:hypothetical protein
VPPWRLQYNQLLHASSSLFVDVHNPLAGDEEFSRCRHFDCVFALVCTVVSMCGCTCVCVFNILYLCLSLYVYVFVFVLLCVPVCMYVYVCLCVRVYAYVGFIVSKSVCNNSLLFDIFLKELRLMKASVYFSNTTWDLNSCWCRRLSNILWVLWSSRRLLLK